MARKSLAYKKRKKKNYPIMNYPTKIEEREYYFSTMEIWNTKSTIATFIEQCLRAYKDHDKAGVPWGCAEMDEWNEVIQKMIDAFGILKYGRAPSLNSDEENRIAKEGFDLFCKYFHHLWD